MRPAARIAPHCSLTGKARGRESPSRSNPDNTFLFRSCPLPRLTDRAVAPRIASMTVAGVQGNKATKVATSPNPSNPRIAFRGKKNGRWSWFVQQNQLITREDFEILTGRSQY